MMRTAAVVASILCTLADTATGALNGNSASQVPPFMRSLSDYSYMHYERCLRVKIPDNNDDDGNSYFYNGAYRTQGQLYIAYRLCSTCGCSDGGESFLAPAENVIEEQIYYTQGYCNACSNNCRRRRAEEEENNGNGNYNVDCKTCVDHCAPLLKNYYEGNDETQYLECQEAYADEDGIQYYSAPACDNDGMLTIGLFYDEDCTVKKDDSTVGEGGYGGNFAKNTFLSLEGLCINCADGLCDDVEQGLQCENGANVNGNVDDDYNACKAYKKVTKEWKYASPKRNYHAPFILSVLCLVGLCCCGSYTYFVRHKRAAEKAALDSPSSHHEREPTKAEYAEMT